MSVMKTCWCISGCYCVFFMLAHFGVSKVHIQKDVSCFDIDSASNCKTSGNISELKHDNGDGVLALSSDQSLLPWSEVGVGGSGGEVRCVGAGAGVSCSSLPASCLSCRFNSSCVYGANVTVLCRAAHAVVCQGGGEFEREMVCRYCYQTPISLHHCSSCSLMLPPLHKYRANCSVDDHVMCLGRRSFHKSLPCKWTKGDRWGTALLLSVVFGGFGVDRFYLGHWQEGIGKFFSFGGLGVWTVVDVLLIAIGYLGPADGSLYIT